MEQQFAKKIFKIQEALNEQCILKASVFEKSCDEAKILADAKGSKWNKYVHKKCTIYKFEIWKDKSDQNFYVKSNEKCRIEALSKRLTPHSTSELLRGEKRKIAKK